MTPVKGYIIVKIIQISIIFIAAVRGNDEDIPMKLGVSVLFEYDLVETYNVVRERRMVRLTSTTMSTKLLEYVTTT